MDVYKYPYSDDIGEFVLMSILDDDKVLVYSRTTKTFPRFKILLGTMFEQCELIERDSLITKDVLLDEYRDFKIEMSKYSFRSSDKGHQRVLEECDKYINNY